MWNIKLGCWLQLSELEKTINEHNKAEDIHLVNNDQTYNKLVKKYYDEVLPIFYYAKQYGATEVFYVDDNKPDNEFDGKLKVKEGIISIECTKAVNEKNAELQNFLREHYCGYTTNFSMPADEFKKGIIQIVENGIKEKINKANKKPNKYKGFHLILTLDDILFTYCSLNEFLIGMEQYFTMDNIIPFSKVIFCSKTGTGYPTFLKEIG